MDTESSSLSNGMDVQHLNAKFFVEDPRAVDLAVFLSLFSGWIQTQVGEELLIDVADYQHVAAGPGVVLIGHEANYSIDNEGDRLGLLYNRKAVMRGGAQERLEQVVRSALLACRRIEEDPLLEGRVRFSGGEVRLVMNDRLLAPNTEETFSFFTPELEIFLKRLYQGARYTLERPSDPRERFAVSVKVKGSFDVAALLENFA